ncbi:MAG: hypothetical protein K2P93_01285 [Alphaproteobacteria bacterium]|nr:hypothetical protein [Alphaproteobacteria bacterium]
MELWRVIILAGIVSNAEARIVETSYEEEEKAGASSSLRPDMDNEGKQGEKSSFSMNEKEGGMVVSQELEDDPMASLRGSNESVDSIGGGLRQIDAKLLNPSVPPPTVQLPWWERWWLAVDKWIFGATP